MNFQQDVAMNQPFTSVLLCQSSATEEKTSFMKTHQNFHPFQSNMNAEPKWTTRPPRNSGFFANGKRKIKNKTMKECNKARHLSSTCKDTYDNGCFTSSSHTLGRKTKENKKEHVCCRKPRDESLMLGEYASSVEMPSYWNEAVESTSMNEGVHNPSLSWMSLLPRKKRTDSEDIMKPKENGKFNESATEYKQHDSFGAVSYSTISETESMRSSMLRGPRQRTTKSKDGISAAASKIAKGYIETSLTESKMVVDCARALLQDCIRERTYSSAERKKKALKDDSLASRCLSSNEDIIMDEKAVKEGSDCFDSDNATKTTDDDVPPWRRGLTWSTDEEMQALTKMSSSSSCESNETWERSRAWPLPSAANDQETCFEEKGIPIEVRYQLPLSLSTARQRDSSCTICQTNYGIGEHITTLPCGHFFHAICADRWLWNHVSCPICRAEIDAERVLNGSAMTTTVSNELSAKETEDTRRRLKAISYGFRRVHNTVDQDESDRMEDSVAILKKIICPVEIRQNN